MRSFGVLSLAVSVLSASTADAGAWLREQGKGFIAGSVTAGGDDTIVNAYAEYGWRPNTTVGLDVESNSDATNGTAGVFVVRPLGPTDQTSRYSWNIGGGLDWSPVAMDPFLKGGVSWGRGITLGTRSGWATVDASVKWSFGDAPTTTKIDSTLGLGLNERVQGMMQLFITFDGGDASVKLAPSLLYSPKSGAFTVQLGAEIPSTGDTTFKIGLWRNF